MPEPQSKSIPEITSELWALTKDYAKQETIDPLKGVGRYLTFGVPGALLIGFGMVLLMLSGLRALQTQTGSTFTRQPVVAPVHHRAGGGGRVGRTRRHPHHQGEEVGRWQ